MSEIRLIVNADDLGMSRGITDAIIIGHRFGFLTSASLMVNMPAAEYALGRTRAFPNLGLGIHLNICQGRPLLPACEVAELVDSSGNFYSPREMAGRLWRWQVSSGAIEQEFRAQIQWMKARGASPSHADSHHHMHLYPAAVRAFARALEAEGVSCMRACRCEQWPKSGAVGGPYRGGSARRVLTQAYRYALQRTVFRQFDSAVSRVTISPADPANPTGLRERWQAAFENLPPGTFELACHPGLFERGFSETDAIRERREEDLLCLVNRDLRSVIERRAIRPIGFRDLRFYRGTGRIAEVAA